MFLLFDGAVEADWGVIVCGPEVSSELGVAVVAGREARLESFSGEPGDADEVFGLEAWWGSMTSFGDTPGGQGGFLACIDAFGVLS